MKIMGKVVLIEPEYALNEYYCKSIFSYLKHDVINLKDIQSAIKYLISDSAVEMIIVRDSFTGVNNVGVLTSFLRKNKIEIPIVIFGENSFEHENEIIISPSQSPKKSLREISSILNVILNDFSEIALTDFKEVPLFYFYQLNKMFSTCDIYRATKNNEVDHYEQIYGTNESFNRHDMKTLSIAGIKSLFIKEEYYDDFIIYATEVLINKLDKNLTEEQLLETLNDAYLIIQDRLHRKIVDDTTRNLITGVCSKSKTILENNSHLSSFLKNISYSKIDYPFLRFILIGSLSINVLKSLKMKSDATLDKFNYVNFFHDIYLNHEKLLLTHCEEDVAKQNLTKEESSLVLAHARLASELVTQLDFIPHGVGDILIEHHGSKNGVGFKNKLSITLSPMSMILIVVEEFAIELLRLESNSINNLAVENIFIQLGPIYNKITFKDTLNALKESINLDE